MDKLSDSELKTLFNEPIYVINDSSSSRAKEPAKDKKPNVTTDESGIIVKGKFEKHILVLINTTSAESLPSEDQVFFYKGLEALGYGEDDIAVVNISQSGDQWKSLNDVKIVIALGVDIENIPRYEVTQLKGALYLLSDSVNEIRASHELKVKFWKGLKGIFNN